MVQNDKKISFESDRVFKKIEKSRKMTVFGLILAIFGLVLSMFLTFQSYDFDAFAHAGAPFGIE